jgi:hypothetical protein
MKRRRPFEDAAVRAVFEAYPARLRADLLALRELIFDTASETEGVGALIETLKWGQPAYVPSKPRTGSTVRIDVFKPADQKYGIFFHCQTTLVSTFRELYGSRLLFQGERAIVFSQGEKVPREALGHCIALALTYHLKPRRS